MIWIIAALYVSGFVLAWDALNSIMRDELPPYDRSKALPVSFVISLFWPLLAVFIIYELVTG